MDIQPVNSHYSCLPWYASSSQSQSPQKSLFSVNTVFTDQVQPDAGLVHYTDTDTKNVTTNTYQKMSVFAATMTHRFLRTAAVSAWRCLHTKPRHLTGQVLLISHNY